MARRHQLGLLFAVWSIPGLVSTLEVWRAGDPALPLARLALWQLSSWYVWVALTPLVLGLARRFPLERGQLGRSLPAHLIAPLCLSVPHLALSALAGRVAGVAYYRSEPFTELVGRLVERYLHLDVLTYMAVVATGLARAYYQRYRARELAAAELESRLLSSELAALKMQVHPHFLFNTLNAISVLVRKGEGARAVAALGGLAELLRSSLTEGGRQTTSLQAEVEFTRRYLELEQLRLGDRLRVAIEVPAELLGCEVPTLLLQPLVENAVRHGIAARPAGGTVWLRASGRGGRLVLEVSDDGVGLADGFVLEAQDGIGLANVRARLALLHPDDHAMAVAGRPGGGTKVSLELPLVAAAEAA
jgi:two-component system LytT family sensor kinase